MKNQPPQILSENSHLILSTQAIFIKVVYYKCMDTFSKSSSIFIFWQEYGKIHIFLNRTYNTWIIRDQTCNLWPFLVFSSRRFAYISFVYCVLIFCMSFACSPLQQRGSRQSCIRGNIRLGLYTMIWNRKRWNLQSGVQKVSSPRLKHRPSMDGDW